MLYCHRVDVSSYYSSVEVNTVWIVRRRIRATIKKKKTKNPEMSRLKT